MLLGGVLLLGADLLDVLLEGAEDLADDELLEDVDLEGALRAGDADLVDDELLELDPEERLWAEDFVCLAKSTGARNTTKIISIEIVLVLFNFIFMSPFPGDFQPQHENSSDT